MCPLHYYHYTTHHLTPPTRLSALPPCLSCLSVSPTVSRHHLFLSTYLRRSARLQCRSLPPLHLLRLDRTSLGLNPYPFDSNSTTPTAPEITHNHQTNSLSGPTTSTSPTRTFHYPVPSYPTHYQLVSLTQPVTPTLTLTTV